MAAELMMSLRSQLIKGLTESVISGLVDDLKEKNVLGGEEIEEIMHIMKKRSDKARDLIDSVTKKGNKASEVMLACLKTRDSYFFDSLNIDSHLTPPEAEATSSHLTSDKPKTKGDEYKMDSDPRGLSLIINNENFKNPKTKKRNGSKKDVDSMKDLFQWLGFQVQIEKDQSASEIKMLMIQYSKHHHHGDCFVCCVMSHGDNTGVLGYDEQICPLNDITSPFNGVNCPSLIGKPKVFFIQACRGSEMQSRVLVADSPGASRMQNSGSESYSIPKDSDFLIAMSTVEGYMAIRDEASGSWFIQSLCNHLKEGSKRDQDILSILTDVNNDVSRNEGIIVVEKNVEVVAKVTPQPIFTLRKRLIFRAPKGRTGVFK